MKRALALLAIAFILLSPALAQNRAEVVWQDGSTTVVPMGRAVDVGRAHLSFTDEGFELLNGGNPDPTPQVSPRPQPLFIQAITLFLDGAWICPLGAMVGARAAGVEQSTGLTRWEIVTLADWKQAAAYPTNTFPEYADMVRGSRSHRAAIPGTSDGSRQSRPTSTGRWG
jgi:hypothetical protein